MRQGWLMALTLLMVTAVARTQEVPVELDKDRQPTLVTKGSCLIKGGTLLTVARGELPGTDILVQNGKIVAIGKNLTPPSGATVIDAAGKFVTPGIVDAHSHSIEEATNEYTDSITAEVRIHDVLDPQSLSIYRNLANGVTSALILHGSANAIGGQSVVVKMKWKHPVEDLIIPDAPRMIKFALGENVKGSNRGGGRYPSTRSGVESVYRRAFSEAQQYMKAWDRYEAAKKTDSRAMPPRRDLRLETLAGILKRDIWVQCHCYRADEMLMLLRLAKEFGFKIGALQHALEAYKIAPEILASGAGVSTFADFWGYKVEAYDAIPYNAAMCLRAGIVTSVNTDGESGDNRLNIEAARCMRYGGLNTKEALALITSNPAIQLGIAKRTGSLEPGKDADIAVWSGHPFSVYSKCVLTLVEGEVGYQRRDAFGVDRTSLAAASLNPSTADPLKIPPVPEASAYALVGATVHPITSPDIANGMVIVQNGRITAVGAKAAVPHGAVVVNAKGLHIYPGMIDAGSQLGLTEIEQVNATIDTSEGGTFQPDLLALTAVNPSSEHFAVTRCDGLTTALTSMQGGGFFGGGSLIVGQSAVINLAGWTPDEMKVKSPTALHVSFPQGISSLPEFFLQFLPPDALEQRKEQEKTQIRQLGEYFDRAKRYQAARSAMSDRVPYDPRLEAMQPYVQGKLPVVFHVSSTKGVRNALKFATDHSLKPIIAGDSDLWKSASLLAKQHVPVIYHLPMNNSAESSAPANDYDPNDAVWAAPGVLQKAGVTLCFASNDAPLAKNLPFQVGITCAYGLSHEAALKALTIQAAQVLGVADQVGSLERGKIANLIVTDGDPLEVTTHLHYLFIAGQSVPLESRHTRLYEKYRQRLTPTGSVPVTAHKF